MASTGARFEARARYPDASMAPIASSEALRTRTESVNQAIEQARKTSLGQFFTAWGELRAGEGAILIAWQLLFSLFPLIVGILSIFGLVLRDPELQAALAEQIVARFPSQASDLVGFISETRNIGGILGIISLITLLWAGSNLFGTMATVFDRFYGVPDRSFVTQRVVSFSMMAAYAVLATISVAAGSVTGILVGLSEEILSFEIPYFAFALGWLVSVASAILMFLVLYRFVPNARLGIRHVWKGAVLAGVAFVALTQIFPLYLSYLGSGFAAYKALGVFLLLMTWFYFLGLILCAGTLLNAVLAGLCPIPSAEQAQAEKATQRQDRRQARDSGEAGDGSGGPVKVVVWTGLTAVVTSLMLILARRLAGTLWRALTRQEPPG
jgi:membrane protein